MTAKPTEAEMAARRRVVEDFLGLSDHIPPQLRARLESELPADARKAVLELQMLAIQYGRGLEQRDALARLEAASAALAEERQRKAAIQKALVNVDSQFKPMDPKAIVVVPTHAFSQMQKG